MIDQVRKLILNIKNLRNPSLGCLYSKESNHGHGTIIIVEGFSGPDSFMNLGSYVVVQAEHKKFTPEK